MMTMAAEDQAAVPRVVSILSALLERVAERNDVVAAVERRIRDVEEQEEEEEDQGEDGKDTTTTTKKKKAVSAFQGLTKPAISVGGYLERIFRFAGCSPSCYVVAYIYLDRFLRRRPALAVDSFNVHRLLITSVLTAVKFVDDMYVIHTIIHPSTSFSNLLPSSNRNLISTAHANSKLKPKLTTNKHRITPSAFLFQPV